MTRPSNRQNQSSKIEILEAALDLVREAGAINLTIDAVAERSGFSKGGVLYNFRTKDALILAMVRHLADRFKNEIWQAREAYEGAGCPTLLGMIDVTEQWIVSERSLARAVLVTSLSTPDLVEPFLELKQTMKQELENEAGNIARVMVVWSALEGLHFCSAHGVSAHTDEERKTVFMDLRKLASEIS